MIFTWSSFIVYMVTSFPGHAYDIFHFNFSHSKIQICRKVSPFSVVFVTSLCICPAENIQTSAGDHPILDTRISVRLSFRVSRSDHPPWILKGDGLESSGRRLISLIGKTKGIAFFPNIFSDFWTFQKVLTFSIFFLWIFFWGGGDLLKLLLKVNKVNT